MNKTEAAALHKQMEVLKHQIELEESNYKYAVELGQDYETLLLLREQTLDVGNKLNE